MDWQMVQREVKRQIDVRIQRSTSEAIAARLHDGHDQLCRAGGLDFFVFYVRENDAVKVRAF